MPNFFTAKVNALLAAFLTVLLAVTLSLGVFFFMNTQLDRVKAQLDTANKALAADGLQPVKEAAAYIEDNFVGDLSDYSVAESAVAGMIDGLGDRWSYYVSPDEMAAYYENLYNSYVGIGVTVTKEDGGFISVQSVNPGSGAEDVGIVAGDQISAVDGLDVSPFTLDECKEMIRGEEGSFVRLTVIKADGYQEELDIERRTVVSVIVTGQMLGSIGYLKLENFNVGSADAFIEMTNTLIDSGAEALVFDVRFNGGGRLSELVDILDYLLPEGEIFRCVDKMGEETLYTSGPDCIKLPMAVLINDSSYSAAEYFAAALEQYGVAVTVGSATVGKGYAQNTFTLSDGSAIAISVFQYFTPNGDCLQGVGLTPNYELEVSDEEYLALYYSQLAIEEDTQLQKALQVVLAGE